jgi:tRNA(Ile)-lysidine synthase
MGVDVRCEYGLLFVRARTADSREVAGWLDVPGSLALGDGSTLEARLVIPPHDSDPSVVARTHGREWDGSSVLLDAEACGVAPEGGRLWVVSPQAGDVMCPLGMHGQSKKLSDLLIDEKVPAAERGHVAVVRNSPTGPVVWVAGIRPDERARCVASTKVLLELGIHPS